MTILAEHQALPSATCDECGRTSRVQAEFAEHWLSSQSHILATPEETSAAMLRAAIVVANWVIRDEKDQDVRVCPSCVNDLRAERAKATCPPWCRTDHATEKVVGHEWAFNHCGPDFGPVELYRWTDDPLFLTVTAAGDIEIRTEDDRGQALTYLRDLSAGAAAAAEWLAGLDLPAAADPIGGAA